jgi:formylglycine-generating enzyme required for sulfatase activity
MTRNYGQLSGGRRRGGSGAWQWIVIGFVVGFGCAAVLGLALVITGATGLLGESVSGIFSANLPTQTPFVITNTPAPATDTPQPTEALLPTATVGQVQVLPPTPTPTTDPSLILVEPSATPTTPVPTQASVSLGAGGAPAARIPEALVGKLSEMRQVSGGTFLMGTTVDEVARAVTECTQVYEGVCQLSYGEDSSPAHQVTIDPFMMEVTEVTYDQFLTFLNSKGPNSHRNGCDGQVCLATRAEDANSNVIFDSVNYRVLDAIRNHPVVSITWYGARAYCAAIGRRLPTEAEWERAARGPNNTLYPWGDTFDTSLANTSRPRVDPALDGAEPVTSYPLGASAFGMLNMAGNVAEWVADWYSPTFYSQQAQQGNVLNPTGPVAGIEKVVRGGSWDAVPFFSRSVHRQSAEPQRETLWIGFRCAADLDTAGAAAPGAGGVAVTTPLASAGSSEEEPADAAPTLPPLPPTSAPAQPLPTLPPS